MLLRFAIENHLSIKDRQELSMVSAKAIKDGEDCLIPCPASPSGHVVPVAIIYGANASGKSNIVSGFKFLTDMVLTSYTRLEPNAKIPRQHFLLDSDQKQKSTEVSIDYYRDNVRHNYGFESMDESFVSEWLYKFPKGRQKIFDRDKQDISYGRSLRGPKAMIGSLTNENTLIVSAGAQNNFEALSEIYFYISSIEISRIVAVGSDRVGFVLGDRVDERVIKLLEQLGTGVVDYEHEVLQMPGEIKRMLEKIEKGILSVESDIKEGDEREANKTKSYGLQYIQEKHIIKLGHLSKNGTPVYFDLPRESSGTRRLLLLLHSTFQALDRGSLLIIDELDTSLHTQACEAIIALFSSRETNPNGAQLIATTHDTNLLRSSMLRRDQIWFTEKDDGGATHLYPLSDFKVRKEDNLEKGYLQGRFGAIPFAGSAHELFGKSDNAA